MLKHLGVASFVVFGIVINSQWGEGSGFGSLFSFSWDSGTGDLLDNGELLEDSFPEDFVWGVATSAYQVKKRKKLIIFCYFLTMSVRSDDAF